MKKFVLLFLIFSVFSPVFAEFNDDKITKFLEFDLASTTTRGIERYQNQYSLQGGLVSRWADGLLGFQAYDDIIDFSLAAQVWFPFTNWQFDTSRIALGCGGLYHFQDFFDISCEHDFIFDTTFRYKSDSDTTISFWGGYSLKLTKIFALSDLTPYIHDDFMEFVFLVDKIWQNGMEVFFEHGLHDFYRYPLFCSPHYKIGAAINLDSGLRFGSDISMRIVDGYAASPYVDSLIFRLTARYTF